MKKRTRLILVFLGLLLVIISLAALSYAFSTPDVLRETVPLAPTLFTLPPAGGP